MKTKADIKKEVKEIIKDNFKAGRIDALIDVLFSHKSKMTEDIPDNWNFSKAVVCALGRRLDYHYGPVGCSPTRKRQFEREVKAILRYL